MSTTAVTTTTTTTTVGGLRKSLPPHIFKKDPVRSYWYLFVDLVVIFTLVRFYCDSEAMSWPMYFVYCNVLGFFMWCLFVIGHDAGHGTFSDSPVNNAVVGHITHGFLLVPFWPWKHSHAQHHAFHNHKSKDKSHVWSAKEDEKLGKYVKSTPLVIPIAFGIFYLLLGIADGSHYNPFSKLHTTRKDRIQCAISSLVCIAFLAVFFSAWGSRTFGVYFGPWLVYNTWLYAVTYLQHHMSGTLVYGDSTWTFLNGGLETVDRVYDQEFKLLDDIMHNITNGHVAHHLFSTSIPHYNLMEATQILRPQLGDRYKIVKGFPLVELVRDHWYSTRKYLIQKSVDVWEWI